MKNIIKNIVNAKKEKTTQKLPMPSNVKKGFRRYCITVLALALCSSLVLPASATGGDPLTAGHLRHDPGGGHDPAGLGHRTGWPVFSVPRPVPALQWFPDPGRRCHHHFCQGDSDSDYRLIIWEIQATVYNFFEIM